jgi:hypothetical protein
MTWNANIPATNAALLSAPLRENFQALDTSFYAPLTAATDGYLLYRAAGPTVSGESNLLWDATNNNLRLFGGGVGTSGNGVLALGPSTTAPTTSPVDTVQLYTADLGGVDGNRGFKVRDERGGVTEIGSVTGGTRLLVTEYSGVGSVNISATPTVMYFGCTPNIPIVFQMNSVERMRLDGASGVLTLTGPLCDIHPASGADAQIRLDASGIGGHQWNMWSAGTGTGIPGGVNSFAVADSSAGAYRLIFAPNGVTYLSCAGYNYRLLSTTAPDSAGAGWRYVTIAN